MQRYMTVKYAGLLLGLIFIFGIIHTLVIAPFLSCFIVDATLSELTQTICLFIIEPTISVLIMIMFINKKETELYDSLS